MWDVFYLHNLFSFNIKILSICFFYWKSLPRGIIHCGRQMHKYTSLGVMLGDGAFSVYYITPFFIVMNLICNSFIILYFMTPSRMGSLCCCPWFWDSHPKLWKLRQQVATESSEFPVFAWCWLLPSVIITRPVVAVPLLGVLWDSLSVSMELHIWFLVPFILCC